MLLGEITINAGQLAISMEWDGKSSDLQVPVSKDCAMLRYGAALHTPRVSNVSLSSHLLQSRCFGSGLFLSENFSLIHPAENDTSAVCC